MPRTPLLRALAELAQDHRDADRLGITPEQARISRRDFVKRSGAAGALVVGGSMLLPRAARASTRQRIAIVGGGIAGLNAALTLADSGIASTVFESSNRLGGRMHSDSPLVVGGDNYFQGQVTEYCGEFIDSNHKTILTLVKRFNLTADDVLAAQPNASTETYYFLNGYYSYTQASNDFQPVHNTLQGQVQATSYPTLYNSYTQAGYNFDQLSLYDWIEQYVPGGHGSRFGRLLDSAYNQEYGADTTDQSSLNIIYLLGYKAKPGNFQIYGASDERFHINGGNQRLPETMASYLKGTGLVTINTGARMNTVARNSDGTVSLTFDGSPKASVFDQVILCMSFSVLRTLNYAKAGFDSLKQTAITQLGSGRNAKLALQFDSRYWNGSGPWGISNGDVYTDIGFQNTWDSTRAQAGTTGILVNYTGGSVAGAFSPSTPYSNASNNPQVASYAQAFLKQVETVFPGLTSHYNGRAVLSTPFQDPNFNCSYSYWRVGQYTQFSGYEKAAQGPIHFAGEHCSQDFQGFMEGGASEGARAANEILASVK
ncbi:MAG: monoamine oxidase [Solirubrobacteraceae bacterium]|jgi:monoamine oxidase|nr:monoamine oxidase [Solirubrobacteraceae bacterium]